MLEDRGAEQQFLGHPSFSLINSLVSVEFDEESFGNKIKLFRSDLGSLLPKIVILVIE